jgi:hypothetical protein
MLRRIKAEQLQVGMFVARLGGPWINHPFWRSRFLVTSDEQVEQIQSANVQDVWIDILKGRNLPMPARRKMMEADVTRPESSFEEELERARELIKSGRALIGNLFNDVRMGRALEPTARCCWWIRRRRRCRAIRRRCWPWPGSRPRTTTPTCIRSRSAR